MVRTRAIRASTTSCIELIAHTDGRLDATSVSLMIAEYQRVTTLTLGELWAIPVDAADGLSRERPTHGASRGARRRRSCVGRRVGIATARARMSPARPPKASWRSSTAVRILTPAFLTRFLQQIRSRRSDFTPLLWLEQWIAEDVMTGRRRGAAIGAGAGADAARDGEFDREPSSRREHRLDLRSSRPRARSKRGPARRSCAGRTRR